MIKCNSTPFNLIIIRLVKPLMMLHVLAICLKCSYLTPEQFREDRNEFSGKNNFLHVYFKSISKKLDSLKECIKSLYCKFDVIGMSETHLRGHNWVHFAHRL